MHLRNVFTVVSESMCALDVHRPVLPNRNIFYIHASTYHTHFSVVSIYICMYIYICVCVCKCIYLYMITIRNRNIIYLSQAICMFFLLSKRSEFSFTRRIWVVLFWQAQLPNCAHCVFLSVLRFLIVKVKWAAVCLHTLYYYALRLRETISVHSDENIDINSLTIKWPWRLVLMSRNNRIFSGCLTEMAHIWGK